MSYCYYSYSSSSYSYYYYSNILDDDEKRLTSKKGLTTTTTYPPPTTTNNKVDTTNHHLGCPHWGCLLLQQRFPLSLMMASHRPVPRLSPMHAHLLLLVFIFFHSLSHFCLLPPLSIVFLFVHACTSKVKRIVLVVVLCVCSSTSSQ